MNSKASFMKDHDELLLIVNEISEYLIEDEILKHQRVVSTLLNLLLFKLTLHLSVEDEILYPSLLTHSNEAVRNTAQRFVDEMGGIAQAVTKYSEKWDYGAALDDDPKLFIEESKCKSN